MTPVTADELSALLRVFLAAYRARFDALADAAGPVPLLEQQDLDLVRVNGGRAVHFFFTTADQGRRATRLHDVEMHPPATADLKAVAAGSPAAHRDQVRRVAEIDGALYLHFILWPEDGALDQVLIEVAGTVAEREVRRAQGEDLADDVPGVVREVRPDDAPDWIRPAP